VHIEDGFETSFSFRINSSCLESDALDCAAGDGFALVLHGGDSATAIGCGESSMGYASDHAKNCDNGIRTSFIVEFDTYHNPELHDINTRGFGTVSVNATEVEQYQYVHAAFFSQGEAASTANHATQIAGTPAIPSIADGALHQARLVYIAGGSTHATGRFFLYIDDMQSFVLTAPVRLARQGQCSVASSTTKCVLDSLGNAYLGFTAASGEKAQMHDIYDWHFCDAPNCGR
jgi:hypothetical protein